MSWKLVALYGVTSFVSAMLIFFILNHFTKKIQQRWVLKEFRSLPPEISENGFLLRRIRFCKRADCWLALSMVAMAGSLFGVGWWAYSAAGASHPMWQQLIVGWALGLETLCFYAGMHPAAFYDAVDSYYRDSLEKITVEYPSGELYYYILKAPPGVEAKPIHILNGQVES